MENRIWYAILLWAIALLIWATTMWPEKMIKLILANYLIWWACFALWQMISQFSHHLSDNNNSIFTTWAIDTKAESRIVDTTYSLSQLLQNWQLTFELLLFAVLVFLVYTSSTTSIAPAKNPSTEKLLNLIYIPLTLLSFVFAIYIALMAEWIPPMDNIIASLGTTFPVIESFISNIYLRMFIHSLIVLLITSKIKFKFKLNKKTTTLPAWLENL